LNYLREFDSLDALTFWKHEKVDRKVMGNEGFDSHSGAGESFHQRLSI
jgi:hypothetical protein